MNEMNAKRFDRAGGMQRLGDCAKLARRSFLTLVCVYGPLSRVLGGLSTGTAKALDLDHGLAQMHNLLVDRPYIGYYRSTRGEMCRVREQDSICQWASERFAGVSSGEIIIWNNDLPDAMADALSDVAGAVRNEPASIRIRAIYTSGKSKGQHVPFEQLWRCLAFELHNVDGLKTAAQLMQQAREGVIERADFIREEAKLEYRATKRTKDFYEQVWMPWASGHSFESDSRYWITEYAHTFEEWLKMVSNGEYPDEVFGPVYDRLRPPK